MKQWRATKWWKRIIVSAAMGAATTVFVCWALAMGILAFGKQRSQTLVQSSGTEGSYYLFQGEYLRAGVRAIRVSKYAVPIEATFKDGELFKRAGQGTSYTGRLVYTYDAVLVRDVFAFPAIADMDIRYFGLPYEAMHMAFVIHNMSTNVESALTLPGTNWLDAMFRKRAARSRYSWSTPFHLPIGIQPFGFLLNSALFALLWYAPLYGVGDARLALRRRRQQCEQCGYPRHGLASHTPCPECGHPLREHT